MLKVQCKRQRMELTAVIWGEGCERTESNSLAQAGIVREAFLEEMAIRLSLAG